MQCSMLFAVRLHLPIVRRNNPHSRRQWASASPLPSWLTCSSSLSSGAQGGLVLVPPSMPPQPNLLGQAADRRAINCTEPSPHVLCTHPPAGTALWPREPLLTR